MTLDPSRAHGAKPEWLTFDCYGTLIQWGRGLLHAVETILRAAPDRESRYGSVHRDL